MIDKGTALKSLLPTAEWIIRGEVIEWLSPGISQPTEDEIQAEITRLQAEYDAKEYQRKRQVEYPTIEECVHAILDNDLENLQALRQAVKEKYPK